MSLRLRLTLLNGLVLLVAIGAFAVIAYASQHQALQNSLDGSLRDQARWFSDNAHFWFDRARGGPRAIVFPNPQRFSAPDVFIQITMRDGQTVARSGNLEDQTLPSSPEMVRRALEGHEWFVDIQMDGQPLRLFVAPLQVGPSRDAAPVGVIHVARPLGTMHKNLSMLQTTFLTLAAAGVVASLAIGWLLARAALRPIDRLAAAAHAIGAARDFGQRVRVGADTRRGDEVGRLADEFNQMLAQLQAAYEQLEAALAGQRRFVADASHELRTPLTSLRGNVELLRRMAGASRSRAGSEEQEQVLADMAAETERLARLVADLLLLARADAGQHLGLAPTDLGPLVRDAFRSARFLREEVALQLGDVPEHAWVAGDADRLKQLLLILLDNALKYTPAGGCVSVGALPAAHGGVDGVTIRVADTGPGIPPEEQTRVFERFCRLDRARGAGGAGLGLAIARWIVDEHRGTIDVDSLPDGGSTFSVWLPTVPPPAPAPEEPARTGKPVLAG